MQRILTLIATALLAVPGTAWPHGESKHTSASSKRVPAAEETAFGRPGEAGRATRTITVDMRDTMRFVPAKMTVRRGETVRFVVKNSGKVMHELVLGTMADLKRHAELMKKHPGMEHDEPYMAHVAPGKSEGFLWQFTRSGTFHFGCLVPGHFEAGMQGTIHVAER